MNDLYDWLSRQHHGLRTFQLFRVKLADLSEREPDKKALYALMSRWQAAMSKHLTKNQLRTAPMTD
jgi:hypothetical protein